MGITEEVEKKPESGGGGGSPFISVVCIDFISNPALVSEDERILLKEGDGEEIKALT